MRIVCICICICTSAMWLVSISITAPLSLSLSLSLFPTTPATTALTFVLPVRRRALHHNHNQNHPKYLHDKTLSTSLPSSTRGTLQVSCATLEQHPSFVLEDGGDNLTQNRQMNKELRRYSSAMQSPDNRNAMKSVRSFKRFLDSTSAKSATTPDDSQAKTGEEQVLCSAMIHSFRACGQAGDYRMILSLLQSALNSTLAPQLSPRVFGEALHAMARTDASVSKLKQVWNLGIASTRLTAYELNVMLQALGQTHNKLQAALSLYRMTDIQGDAYTASTLINLLTSSIQDPQTLTDIDKKTAEMETSTCWQYREGLQILNEASPSHLNNFVISAALQLNQRVTQVYEDHDGARAALSLLGFAMKHGVTPDDVTCTHVLVALQHEWKAAVAMLDTMRKHSSQKSKPEAKSNSMRLPPPNQYAYSSAISACATCHEYEEALSILQQMRNDSIAERGKVVQPNTYIYNAALSACVSSSRRRHRHRHSRPERVKMALSLLKDMQHDANVYGFDTMPDTVSYNTALAALDGLGTVVLRDDDGRRICEFSTTTATTAAVSDSNYNDDTWVLSDTIVSELLQEMQQRNIPRDCMTYQNAILASKTNSGAIFQLLQEAAADVHDDGKNLLSIYNAALSTLAQRGDMDLIIRCFRMMMSNDSNNNLKPNHESIRHLILALGKSRHHSRNITTLLETLRGNKKAARVLYETFGIDMISSMTTPSSKQELQKLYAVSISSCLVANDVTSANHVLQLMKEQHDLVPTQSTMRKIAFAYTKLAVEAASHDSIRFRRGEDEEESSDAKRHAQRAASITKSLKDAASPRLLAAVASAHAITGQFDEARTILLSLHDAALKDQSTLLLSHRRGSSDDEVVSVLAGLHRSLLKICASRANASMALTFVTDIQDFANAVSTVSHNPIEMRLVDIAPLEKDCRNDATLLRFDRTHTGAAKQAGMKGEDWKLLMIAASKSGDWRLCLNTLQFLRPFLKALHPHRATGSSFTTKVDEDSLSRKYRKLARALTASILCFEASGDQCAWAVRAIDDWIEWSGRRPPKEAVLASIRILAKQGRGEEVHSLIQQVLTVQPSRSDTKEEAKHSYEEILYIGAVTHLHNNGLSEEADEIYLQAIANKHLSFSTSMIPHGPYMMLDLHGMNVALANSAVRIAFQQTVVLQQQQQTSGNGESNNTANVMIVTGRGKNSIYQLRPVIRPEIQRMLTEEFYPPLNTVSLPGNMGALVVPAADIVAWTAHQRQERGRKLLVVASVLKQLSSGLQKSLQTKLERRQQQRQEEETHKKDDLKK